MPLKTSEQTHLRLSISTALRFVLYALISLVFGRRY